MLPSRETVVVSCLTTCCDAHSDIDFALSLSLSPPERPSLFAPLSETVLNALRFNLTAVTPYCFLKRLTSVLAFDDQVSPVHVASPEILSYLLTCHTSRVCIRACARTSGLRAFQCEMRVHLTCWHRAAPPLERVPSGDHHPGISLPGVQAQPGANCEQYSQSGFLQSVYWALTCEICCQIAGSAVCLALHTMHLDTLPPLLRRVFASWNMDMDAIRACSRYAAGVLTLVSTCK